jgi:dTDP-4-dehydrorhamnose 3,5-epimerase
MKFNDTSLNGAYVIEPDKMRDERGFFARTFCQREFAVHGIDSMTVQCNISFNGIRGTLRGMHLQKAPYGEARLIRCTRGAIHDVIIDLRRDSATFKRWFAVQLTAKNHKMIYVPQGFAHGFLTLEEDTEVFYQMSEFYRPEFAFGVRWNDPSFGIDWPFTPTVLSERDRHYDDFE